MYLPSYREGHYLSATFLPFRRFVLDHFKRLKQEGCYTVEMGY